MRNILTSIFQLTTFLQEFRQEILREDYHYHTNEEKRHQLLQDIHDTTLSMERYSNGLILNDFPLNKSTKLHDSLSLLLKERESLMKKLKPNLRPFSGHLKSADFTAFRSDFFAYFTQVCQKNRFEKQQNIAILSDSPLGRKLGLKENP